LINTEPAEEFQTLWPGKQSYVGANAADSGTMQGEIIVNLPDKGDLNNSGAVEFIMFTGNPANIDAPLRTEYSKKALTDAGIKIVELEEFCAMWNSAPAEQAMSDFLVKYKKGDIDVIFCNNDGMAYGVIAALDNAGWEVGVDVYLVGVDADPDAMDYVRAGKMTGTVLNDAENQSHKAIDVALQAFKTGDVEKKYYVPYSPVTK
jgi:methyl-galactoside transport system substrate-binding protein